MQWSNLDVLKHVKILPVHLELVIRRLGWLQSLVADPSTGGTYLAYLLGKFSWEIEHDISEHKWMKQLRSDLLALGELEGQKNLSS